MKTLSTGIEGAWIIGREFNNIFNLNDRIGSAITLDESDNFRTCMRECNLQEHEASGPFFTWSNKQEGNEKLFP